MPVPPKHVQELYAIFSAIQTKEEAKKILQDILTPQEIESLAERWQIVKGIAKGMTQREIAQQLGISISKVTRGSRAWQYGSGGFKTLWNKIQAKKKVD